MTQPPLSEADQKKLLEIRRKKLDLEAAIPALWVAATDSKGHLDMVALHRQPTRRNPPGVSVAWPHGAPTRRRLPL